VVTPLLTYVDTSVLDASSNTSESDGPPLITPAVGRPALSQAV
jgi:hypothetical protein